MLCLFEQFTGLANARIGKKVEVTLETRDKTNACVERGGETVTAEILFRDPTGAPKTNQIPVQDQKNGKYTFAFTPETVGKLLLYVYVKGQPIKVIISILIVFLRRVTVNIFFRTTHFRWQCGLLGRTKAHSTVAASARATAAKRRHADAEGKCLEGTKGADTATKVIRERDTGLAAEAPKNIPSVRRTTPATTSSLYRIIFVHYKKDLSIK